MKTSETIAGIASALAAAQGEFPKIAKDKSAKAKGTTKAGKDYEIKYNYADIADVLDAVRPILSKHEIAVMQPTVVDGDLLGIETWLVHKSGEWFKSFYPVCSIQNDHQKMGGALTYSRRYALGSMIGIAADDDDDGQNAATVNSPRHTPRDHYAGPVEPRAEPDESVNYYVNQSLKKIAAFPDVPAMKAWWAAEDIVRRELEILNGSPEYSTLFEAFKARGLALSSAASTERAA